jgi:CRP/FNR family transcriptional regulator, cyclic AMP receptor protein
MCSAIAMADCTVMRIGKKSMMDVIHRERAFSEMLVAYLLTRNIRYEEDLVDQLFNSSEKRLARVLLLLAHFGKEGKPEVAVPKISQETLAEMVGTTRGRVNLPMISADIRDLEHNNKRTLDESLEFQVASVRLLGHVALRLHLEAIERSGGGNVERAIVLIAPR